MSVTAMLFAGTARGIRKLTLHHHSDEVVNEPIQSILYLIIGVCMGIAWMMVSEASQQTFALDVGVGNIVLLILHAVASATAILFGKSLVLPIYIREPDLSTVDSPAGPVWDAVSLTLFAGIVGCWSTLLTGRSYTNVYQFCLFLLATTIIGSGIYICGDDVWQRKFWVGLGTYELLSSPSALLAEESDTDTTSELVHRHGALILRSTFPSISKQLLGISIMSLWTAYGILNFSERREPDIPVLLDHGYLPQLPLEVVLSMYKEPVDEVAELIKQLKDIPAFVNIHVTIYIKYDKANNAHIQQKTGADRIIALPNVGREGETFLNHILNRWQSLARQTIFLQAGIHNPRELYTHIINYYSTETGFLNLGWPGRLCDCENCSDRFSWQDKLHFVPQVYSQMYNSTAVCKKVLLSYKGQFIVSAARIRGVKKELYSELWQAFTDENGWAHQPSYLQGQPDLMSAPYFGYTMERIWSMLFQCSNVDVAWKCPTLLSGWRVGGDISDCQCLDP